MREFKFRAWWKDTKRFLDGDEWYMTCSGAKHLHYSAYPYSDDDFIIEQYTGIKDKNGKEIYEGDIVEQFVCGVRKFKGKECGRKTVWQVRWNKDECCFELHYLSGSLFGDSMLSSDGEHEVIGNIHENHELMEEKE